MSTFPNSWEKDKSCSTHNSFVFPGVVVAWLMMASPAFSQECVECHSSSIGSRTAVISQMKTNSHHVQGTEITSRHCYACHWESTPDGKIDQRYHADLGSSTPDKRVNSAVHLVVWSAGKRPAGYKLFSTAVMYRAAAIGTPSEREEVAKVSSHCLSCHSERNNATTPFEGDQQTPRQYAWDRMSIAARYSQRSTTTWGKYSTAHSNKKQHVVKAFSAHGNAVANQGGWSATNGYDGTIPLTRGRSRAKNIECIDCHNSHGSSVTGGVTSYRTSDGTFNGGLLKETQANKGGYAMNYRPSVNPDINSPNPYNAGAGICFDCHETAQSGATPWGYNSTFGAEQAIMGYKDTPHFSSGVKGSTARFSGRQTRTSIASSHLKAGKFLNYSTRGQINGLCTPCHDPHGVSPTLGDRQHYAVPLLKGTWLASPYREDAPPATMPTKGAYAGKTSNMAMSWDKGELKGSSPDTQAAMSYNTDRNTFGEGKHITESEDQFGGLCLKCHRKESFIGNKGDSVHRAVKGWGANKEHAFPCSKCHQSHNSGLPRLMQTSCLESGPPGLRDSDAAPWFSGKKIGGNRVVSPSSPVAAGKKSPKESVVGCHVRRAGNRASGPPESSPNRWNGVNPW